MLERPTKKLSQIYCWPNYRDCDETAELFYKNATARLSEFPMSGDFAISLCHNGEDKIVHIFADMLTDMDASVKTDDTIQRFSKTRAVQDSSSSRARTSCRNSPLTTSTRI